MVSQDAIFSAIIAFGVALSGGCLTIIHRGWSNGLKIDRVEEIMRVVELLKMRSQVDELWLDRRETWKYLRERGDLEAVNLGIAKRNSPLSIIGLPQESLVDKLFMPYLPRLIEIENEVGHHDENMLFEAVAKRLGAEFELHVCQILKTNSGGCVSAALGLLSKIRSGAKVSRLGGETAPVLTPVVSMTQA